MEDNQSYIYHIFLRISRYFMHSRHNSGLKPGEFGVLWIIEQSEEKALHPSTISKRLGIARPSLTPVLRDLESRGLIRCRTDSEDGRKYLVELTEKCHQFRENQIDRHKLLFDNLIGNLDKQELESLLRILHKMEANLQNHDEKDAHIFL